jgi:C1A family cysteine protease
LYIIYNIMSKLFVLSTLFSLNNALGNLRSEPKTTYLAANIHNISYYEEKFVNWVSEHKIVTKDSIQYAHFLYNFANNDDLIESHNANQFATYTLGHNKFSHMSFDEFKEYVHLGLDEPVAETVESQVLVDSPADLSALPASIDWSTKGAVTGVKDQGNCGSCWSFSATGALEGAYKIKYGTLVSFSEQNLVSCDTIDSACNGGLMDNAFTWTKSNGGLCTENDYPYTSGTTGQKGTCYTTCSKNTAVAPRSFTDVAKNSDSALMTALAQQPVSVAIQANQPAFQLYKSGVLTGTCGTNLDHGVLAVGYGTWTDGTDYYKVKNSWGTSWGMSGYILIQRGNPQRCGECGILCGPPSYPNL